MQFVLEVLRQRVPAVLLSSCRRQWRLALLLLRAAFGVLCVWLLPSQPVLEPPELNLGMIKRFFG